MASGIPFEQYNVVDLATADGTIGGNSATGIVVLAATSTVANGYKNAFAIAQELETFANRDGRLLSGLNTLVSQVFFEASLGYGSTSQANQCSYTLDFYANHDLILVLENGILSARF